MTTVSGVGSQPVYHISSTNIPDDEKLVDELDKQIKQAVKEEKVDEFKKTVEDTQKTTKGEVLTTIIGALVAGGVALKAAPVARRVLAKYGSAAAKGLISLVEKIGKNSPKVRLFGIKAKSFITKAANALRNENSTKIIDTVKNHAHDILGDELKLKTIPIISNIKNDVGIVDAGIATAVGYQSMQPDSEKTNKLINAANNVLIAC